MTGASRAAARPAASSDADGTPPRPRRRSVLVRVVGEESRHASRAHAESHDGDAFRASFAQRRDDGDAAATGGRVPRPPQVGVLARASGRARRTTCHRGGGPGRRRVRRLPRAFARSGSAGRASPARRRQPRSPSQPWRRRRGRRRRPSPAKRGSDVWGERREGEAREGWDARRDGRGRRRWNGKGGHRG